MKILFQTLFLLISFAGTGQTIQETVDYVNDKLIKYDQMTYEYINAMSRAHIEYDKTYGYDEIELLVTGELLVKRIAIEQGEIKSIPFVRSVYLKNLSDSVLIEIIDSFHKETTIAKIRIYCSSGNCIETISEDNPIPNESDEITFLIINNDYSERVKKALIHLIQEASKIDAFKENDPFK